MTNAHRLFLQAILSQPAVPLPKAIYLYSASTTAAYNQDNAINEPPPCRAEDEWPTFRGQINELLDPLKLLLDEKIDQSTGTRWVMLLNTEADPLAQIATAYTPAEIAYLKLIIEAIIQAPSYSFSISALDASRLLSELKTPISKLHGERLMDRFCASSPGAGWLAYSNHRYSLTLRAISELERYLRETYSVEDEEHENQALIVLDCRLCRSIVTKGKICPSCPADSHALSAVHNHCLRQVLLKPNPKCPNAECQVPWKDGMEWLEVGDDVVLQDEGRSQRKRPSSQGQTLNAKGKGKENGKRKKKRRVQSESEEEELEEEEPESEEEEEEDPESDADE